MPAHTDQRAIELLGPDVVEIKAARGEVAPKDHKPWLR